MSIVVCEGNVIVVETMEGYDYNVNSIIDPVLSNRDLESATQTILSIINNIGSLDGNLYARLQTSFRICILNQSVGTLSSYSNIGDVHDKIVVNDNKNDKKDIYTKEVEIKRQKCGFFIHLRPIIQHNNSESILLQVDLLNSQLDKGSNTNSQKLSTVLKLQSGKIEKIGGLYYEKTFKQKKKIWIIPVGSSNYKKKYETFILLKAYVI
jgi:hypothetical protein